LRITILNGEHADEYWYLRQEALKQNGESFATTYEEAMDRENPVEKTKQNLMSNCSITYGSWENGTLVGVVTLLLEKHTKMKHKAHIMAMYVNKEYRGKGIARSLLQTVIKKSKELGLEQLHLTVVSSNTAAVNLYTSVGFQTYGIEKRSMKYNGEYFDEAHMVNFFHTIP
jgi:ribosomal protein S18 acetylase RimI-like enzyme